MNSLVNFIYTRDEDFNNYTFNNAIAKSTPISLISGKAGVNYFAGLR